ncbi:unnamed protein product [Hyaloperonospora brassicae]|uniref:LSM domain-containing protein n=1 Tax=Hyaloperonospora brassicae TaxID=162125 RepID=A0AAV0U4S8_HYABA|nr:unnamed protein product [Hyaloperonospora brassicae]
MTSEKTLFSRFSKLIGQPVRVQVQDGTATAGVLYCIDPETDDVALLVSSGHVVSDYSVKIVLAHDVRGIRKEELDESCGLPTLASLKREVANENDRDGQRDAAVSRQQRREELIQFLTDKYVPFEVAQDGSVRVFGGAATLREPFRTVECGNEQLLRQLQKLLDGFGQLHP